jgi:cytochrome subunit of sulfide dehydrogenase
MEELVKALIPIATAVLAMGASATLAQTPNPNLARNLAATCSNCHGTGGISKGDVASLAGVSKEEIVRKMGEFKSGARPATIMHQLAKGYTDQQVDLIAGWFAAQPAK